MKSKSRVWVVELVILCLLVMLPGVAAAQELVTNTPEGPATVEVVPDAPVEVIGGEDEPVESDDDVPVELFTTIVVTGAGVITALIAAFGYLQGKSISALYKSMPPDVQNFGRALLEIGMDRAARTPDPRDDEELKKAAVKLGFTVTEIDGRTVLTSPAG